MSTEIITDLIMIPIMIALAWIGSLLLPTVAFEEHLFYAFIGYILSAILQRIKRL